MTKAEDPLVRRQANFVSLTPLDFLARAADVYPLKIAVVDGARRISYAALRDRAARRATALAGKGVTPADVVSVLAPNTVELLEAHYGVPLVGGVLNAINTRLDAAAIAAILAHAEAKVFIAHASLLNTTVAALQRLERRPVVVVIGGSDADRKALAAFDYDTFLDASDPLDWRGPADEWDALALNYTSGTTGAPKGAVYSHRGAYLNALGNVVTFGLRPDSVYLWVLPMFHCNGWTYPWAVTAVGARHICLSSVDPGAIFQLIAEHRVTHLCAAPVVLTMLIHSPDAPTRPFAHGPVEVATGGAAPPSAVIAAMERMGFRLTHLYGMTESYGPSMSCAPQEKWAELPLDERALRMSRQGVRNLTVSAQAVLDTATGQPVPPDATTIGEIVVRGNSIMKGYFKNPDETDRTLAGGWLHTGDLAVVHPDGYVEIKDRLKDIIISGGENISSLEIEEVLYHHPAVMEAAVVARPDDKWGETPCAFVTLRPGATASDADIIAFCRANLAGFKCPRTIVFTDLPKTSTGKIQKFVLRDQARAIGM